MLTIENVRSAQRRVDQYIRKTPLVSEDAINLIANAEVFLKLENLQVTHAYKVRGSASALPLLTQKQKQHGIVTASTGNHGFGFSYIAGKLGIDAVVVVPTKAPQKKVDAIQKYGAKIIKYGDTIFEASQKAYELVEQEKRTYVHSFKDEAVFAANGALLLEILQQQPDLDTIIVPIGGGGLISGISFVAKHLPSKIRVYGMQTNAFPSMYKSFHRGELVKVTGKPTIADGVAVKQTTSEAFSYVSQFVDDIFTVTDTQIKKAMHLLMHHVSVIPEPAGAVALAGLIAHRKEIKGKKIGVIVSGGNIDKELLVKIISEK